MRRFSDCVRDAYEALGVGPIGSEYMKKSDVDLQSVYRRLDDDWDLNTESAISLKRSRSFENDEPGSKDPIGDLLMREAEAEERIS